MTKATAFRMDEQVLIDLKKIAKEQERSVNWLVNNTLKILLKGRKKRMEHNSKYWFSKGIPILQIKMALLNQYIVKR